MALFKKGSERIYLDTAARTVHEHGQEIRDPQGDLFAPRYGAYSVPYTPIQRKMLTPVLAGFVADVNINTDFRDTIVPSFGYNVRADGLQGKLSQSEVDEIVKFAGNRLVEQSKSGGASYKISNYLMVLHNLSPASEVKYATKALRNAKGTNGEDTKFIKEELQKSINQSSSVPGE